MTTSPSKQATLITQYKHMHLFTTPSSHTFSLYSNFTMVSSKQETLVYNIRLSSVGPGKVTGQDTVHEPTNMDLAMKLHYLRGVYYFNKQASNDLTIKKIKEAMFTMLNYYYIACGRFRRSDSGRPYIKCNDCGVRFIEADCSKSIDEWREIMNKDGSLELEKLLVYSQPIGPELSFSPNVLVQITKFNCGGITIGMNWAHVLGDIISAAGSINMWAQFLGGDKLLPKPEVKPVKLNSFAETDVTGESIAVKRVGPVGDHWLFRNDTKTVTVSLDVTSTQLSYIQSNMRGKDDAVSVPPFEAICAVIWQCVAKVKNGVEPKVVNVFRSNQWSEKKNILDNNQVISSVKADFSIIEANSLKLALLLMDQVVDEKENIENTIGRDNGLSDFIVYGANLTFVDFTINNFYDLKINKEKPSYVSYIVDGIGEEGVVQVQPQVKNVDKDCIQGWNVTITLPEDQVFKVKYEVEREFNLFD